MDGVGPAHRLGGRLAEADVQHLALFHQLGHRADGFLDRDVGIDPVLVEEVDVVGAESLERPLDRAADVGGRAVHRAHRGHITRDR